MNCSDCRYWAPSGGSRGICHRNPPEWQGGQPETSQTDWCGEWQIKPAPMNADKPKLTLPNKAKN